MYNMKLLPIPTPLAGVGAPPSPFLWNNVSHDMLWRMPTTISTPLNDLKAHLPPPLATDPRLWSRDDVGNFLRWCEQEFDLPTFEMDLFQMNGKALCLLTKTDLAERIPGAGDILHNILHMLVSDAKMHRQLPQSPVTPTSRYHPSSPYGTHPSTQLWPQFAPPDSPFNSNAQLQQFIANSNSVTLSPAPSIDSQVGSPTQNGGGSSSSSSSCSTGSNNITTSTNISSSNGSSNNSNINNNSNSINSNGQQQHPSQNGDSILHQQHQQQQLHSHALQQHQQQQQQQQQQAAFFGNMMQAASAVAAASSGAGASKSSDSEDDSSNKSASDSSTTSMQQQLQHQQQAANAAAAAMAAATILAANVKSSSAAGGDKSPPPTTTASGNAKKNAKFPHHLSNIVTTLQHQHQQQRFEDQKSQSAPNTPFSLSNGLRNEFFPNDSTETSTNGRLLWDFLQKLLNEPSQRYSSFIAWKCRDTGVFKIVDPSGLASLWGIQKNHLTMNYDKMSRALRYYYRVNILRKVQGERHCYQFLRNSMELKSIKNISSLRQQPPPQPMSANSNGPSTSQQQQQQQSQQQHLHHHQMTVPAGQPSPSSLGATAPVLSHPSSPSFSSYTSFSGLTGVGPMPSGSSVASSMIPPPSPSAFQQSFHHLALTQAAAVAAQRFHLSPPRVPHQTISVKQEPQQQPPSASPTSSSSSIDIDDMPTDLSTNGSSANTTAAAADCYPLIRSSNGLTTIQLVQKARFASLTAAIGTITSSNNHSSHTTARSRSSSADDDDHQMLDEEGAQQQRDDCVDDDDVFKRQDGPVQAIDVPEEMRHHQQHPRSRLYTEDSIDVVGLTSFDGSSSRNNMATDLRKLA